MAIDLSQRHQIAGLVKGIEGMRVGGKRELVVSPHLAYGEKGIPGSIPPKAVIRFEVELLEVREAGVVHPENYPPGKHLLVFRPGEAARSLARWQFGLREGDSVAGVQITYPVPGATWRYARPKSFELNLGPEKVDEILESAQSTFTDNPTTCLRNEQMWADASEKANCITRDRATDTLCVTVCVFERGVAVVNYGLPETSPVLLNSMFYQVISAAIAPHLEKAG